jgi:hypothetical protein
VHESRLELARLLLADFDPLVRRIYAQPFRLIAEVEGRMRYHVPDYLLVLCPEHERELVVGNFWK